MKKILKFCSGILQFANMIQPDEISVLQRFQCVLSQSVFEHYIAFFFDDFYDGVEHFFSESGRRARVREIDGIDHFLFKEKGAKTLVHGQGYTPEISKKMNRD